MLIGFQEFDTIICVRFISDQLGSEFSIGYFLGIRLEAVIQLISTSTRRNDNWSLSCTAEHGDSWNCRLCNVCCCIHLRLSQTRLSLSIKFVSAKTLPSIVSRLFMEYRDITRQVTQLTPRLIRVTGHNNTGTGAEPSYQPHSVYTGPLDHPSSELCASRYVLKINF